MTTAPSPDDAQRIFDALVQGVMGQHETAVDLLIPLFERSPQSMYATACALAEAASLHARQQQEPGSHYGITVENTVTGQAASTDDLPPNLRFATRFVTAWANRDHDTADAIYLAACNGDPDQFLLGLRSVYEMAVTSMRAQALQRRTPKAES